MRRNLLTQIAKRTEMFLHRLPTRRLLAVLVTITICVAVPLLSVWQVALAAGDEVRPLAEQRNLLP
ncbi:MAG: hypothetical protein EBU37_03575, partial [Actinobacteria bacterium]|nr:hypothetical protein [Actinomycetota bacterium]